MRADLLLRLTLGWRTDAVGTDAPSKLLVARRGNTSRGQL